MQFRFLPSSQILGRMYNTVVSMKCTMWKVCRSPTLCRYLQTIIECKWHKQGSLSSFKPPTGWGLHRFLENLSENSLKGDLSNATTFNPPLFSLVDTYKTVTSTSPPSSASISCKTAWFYNLVCAGTVSLLVIPFTCAFNQLAQHAVLLQFSSQREEKRLEPWRAHDLVQLCYVVLKKGSPSQ